MRPGVIKESGCWRVIQFARPLEKTLHQCFRVNIIGRVQLIAIRNWRETSARVILTGYGQPFWKGLKHNGSAGNGITGSWTMETLYAPLLARQIWKGRGATTIINLFTYLYIPHSEFLFLPFWNEARFYVQMFQTRAIVLFCKVPIALKNTLILLFKGNSEFNSIAINYSSVVKKGF